jgi:hypothetical protein
MLKHHIMQCDVMLLLYQAKSYSVLNMTGKYTFLKMTDAQLCSAVRKRWAEDKRRFPLRRVPHRQVLLNAHQNLTESGKFH